jgi:hypothetical protein
MRLFFLFRTVNFFREKFNQDLKNIWSIEELRS